MSTVEAPMSIGEALRACPKGRLTYMRQTDLSNLEEAVSPPLSRFHEEREFSKLNASFGLSLSLGSEDSSRSPKNESCECDANTSSQESNNLIKNKDGSPSIRHLKTDDKNKQSDNISEQQQEVALRLSPLSPEHWDSLRAIVDVEEWFKYRAKKSLMERSRAYAAHNRFLADMMKHKTAEARRMLDQQREIRKSHIEKKHQEQKEEANKTLQSLRQNHEKHKEKMDSKQKEIEQKRLHLEREERKRQEEQERLCQTLQDCLADVEVSCAKFTQTLDSYQHKDHLPDTVSKFKVKLGSVLAELPIKLQKAVEAGNITNQLVTEFQGHAEKCKFSVHFLNKQIEEVESKLKAAVEKKKEDEAKQAEDQRKAENIKKLEAEAAQQFGVQALSFALKEREAKSELLKQVEASIQGFVTNPQMKKYRFDIQRAVNTPINAISGVDARHLRDKLHRLLILLRGQEVEVSGRRVKADGSPEALLFCQNLIAKMLVKKGEEQVSSLHESAFPIAAVTLGLWCEFPIVGSLFLAHLQAMCPYVLPHYHTRRGGESNADYHRSLGYKVEEDGTVEEQDKFLRRMSGLMRLYSACLVTSPPPPTPGRVAAPGPHPHGLEHAWAWLARVIDQDPHPDVTATLVYDLLAVAGPSLLKCYSMQFVKLVYLLFKQYLPKLKEVAVTSAALGRLQNFLESSLGSGRMPQPEGVLPQNFWFS